MEDKNLMQAEGQAHHSDVRVADKASKKIHISEKAHRALEEKATAEGKTPNQKAAEIVEEKAKPKPSDSPFPAEAKINDYGFLGFKKSWLENLGWSKGMPLKIEKNADGSITIRKA